MRQSAVFTAFYSAVEVDHSRVACCTHRTPRPPAGACLPLTPLVGAAFRQKDIKHVTFEEHVNGRGKRTCFLQAHHPCNATRWKNRQLSHATTSRCKKTIRACTKILQEMTKRLPDITQKTLQTQRRHAQDSGPRTGSGPRSQSLR
jgi:hypothetical protein